MLMAKLEYLELRRLLSAGDVDMSFGDNAVVIEPAQFGGARVEVLQ
jgi:hypothetical protein